MTNNQLYPRGPCVSNCSTTEFYQSKSKRKLVVCLLEINSLHFSIVLILQSTEQQLESCRRATKWLWI